MRETCSSGSVRGGGGNVPTYSASCLGNRAGFARFVVEFVEPGIGIRLQDAGISGQMLLRMFAATVRRVVEYRRRRCRSAERSVVAYVRP